VSGSIDIGDLEAADAAPAKVSSRRERGASRAADQHVVVGNDGDDHGDDTAQPQRRRQRLPLRRQ
jgi:hypothetical protein